MRSSGLLYDLFLQLYHKLNYSLLLVQLVQLFAVLNANWNVSDSTIRRNRHWLEVRLTAAVWHFQVIRRVEFFDTFDLHFIPGLGPDGSTYHIRREYELPREIPLDLPWSGSRTDRSKSDRTSTKQRRVGVFAKLPLGCILDARIGAHLRTVWSLEYTCQLSSLAHQLSGCSLSNYDPAERCQNDERTSNRITEQYHEVSSTPQEHRRGTYMIRIPRLWQEILLSIL